MSSATASLCRRLRTKMMTMTLPLAWRGCRFVSFQCSERIRFIKRSPSLSPMAPPIKLPARRLLTRPLSATPKRGPSLQNANHEAADLARRQRAAYDYYRKQREASSIMPTWVRQFFRRKRNATTTSPSREQANWDTAWYAVAVVIGAVGATYAAVPLYKVFW
jgi:hypothetical protein